MKDSGLRHSDLLEFRGFHTKGFLVNEGSMGTMVACKDPIGSHGLLACTKNLTTLFCAFPNFSVNWTYFFQSCNFSFVHNR